MCFLFPLVLPTNTLPGINSDFIMVLGRNEVYLIYERLPLVCRFWVLNLAALLVGATVNSYAILTRLNSVCV